MPNQSTVESDISVELKALKELERVVDLTRCARMEASDRLISSERFIQSINIYYSCFSVVLSILCLLESNEGLALISTILTSILAISIVFLNAQHYGERAQQFHDNFLELYQLLFEIRAAIRKEDYDQTSKFEARYIELLKSIENHMQQDFLQVLSLRDRTKARRIENYKKQFTGFPKACFLIKKTMACITKAIIWLFPVFCVLYAVFVKA